MSDPMTIEECRRLQRQCSEGMQTAISSLRKETHEEIAAIREAVQNIDRAVAQIKGHLGINGGRPYPHRRDEEPEDHQHRRSEDSTGGWLKKNWLMLAAILLATFAGEKVVPALLRLFGVQP